MFPFYAMDTSFWQSRPHYPFEVRCEILRDLGYDATYLSLRWEEDWQNLAKLAAVKAEYGLDVAGVYVVLELNQTPEDDNFQSIQKMIRELDGCRNVELAIRDSSGHCASSDTAGDDQASRLLEPLLATALENDISISLYHHRNYWLERIEDSLRLIGRIGHPNLRAVFSALHWFGVDGKQLGQRLEAAAPHLTNVNICGCIKPPKGSTLPVGVTTLDAGDLDLFILLGHLRQLNFAGRVGLQGYSVGGDAYANLRRSIEAYRDMNARLEAHPHWARS